MKKPNKQMVSFRLTPEARALLAQFAQSQGVSQSAIVEQAVRAWAKGKTPKANEPPAPLSVPN